MEKFYYYNFFHFLYGWLDRKGMRLEVRMAHAYGKNYNYRLHLTVEADFYVV